MKIEILEEIRKDYKRKKQNLADEITKAIKYNKKLDEQKINMFELNDKMYKLNKEIKQLNEIIKREEIVKKEKDKETEKQKSVKKIKENWNKLQDILKEIYELSVNIRKEEK